MTKVVTYQIVQHSGNDIVVEKNSDGNIERLYLLSSCQKFSLERLGVFYELTKKLYEEFFKDCNIEIFLFDEKYKFDIVKEEFYNLMKILQFCPEAIKENVLFFYPIFNKNPEITRTYGYMDDILGITQTKDNYKELKPLLKEFLFTLEGEEIISNPIDILFVLRKFGLENAKDFLKQIVANNIDMSKCTKSFSKLEKINFKYPSFVNYFIFARHRLGFNDRTADFVQLWADTLKMEKLIYNHYNDKYPEYLQVTHDQLTYVQRLIPDEIERKRYDFLKKEYSKFEKEYKKEGYIFVLPKCLQDIVDEGGKMHNCIASYSKSVINEKDVIIFMRKAKTPTISYIDIDLQITQDEHGEKKFELVQAKYASNNAVSYGSTQDILIKKWALENHIEVIRY